MRALHRRMRSLLTGCSRWKSGATLFPMTTSAQAATASAIDGPLPLVDLAAFLQAASSVCEGTEGDDHNILTATAVVADRVKLRHGFPELYGCELGDAARIQVAAALCWAVYGRVPDQPVAAAVRWQMTIRQAESAEVLGRMLGTAARLVRLQASNQRAAALLGVPVETADADDGRP